MKLSYPKNMTRTATRLIAILAVPLFLSSFKSDGPTTRIEFEAPETYPEGVAWCPEKNVYFVSSARLGTIGQVSPDGKYKTLYEDPSLKSSYGLKIHPDRKRLFACISDANYSKFKSADTDKKMIRVISLDINSGKKLADVDLSALIPGKHFGNDLTFDKSGNAYITDSFANAIYKIANNKASVLSQNEMFKTAGVGLNGIVWHQGNFLLVASSGKGCLFKVDLANPKMVQKVKLDRFFMNADGLLLTKPNELVLVQNGGSNIIYRLTTTDNWASAKVSATTNAEDRFAFPSTATQNGSDVWVMNAKFNELADSTNVPSKKFSIQKAVFRGK